MRKMAIHELLKWSYTQELPKVGRPAADLGAGLSAAWSGMQAMAELGTIIDRTPNAYGVIPEFLAGDEPNRDAIAVGEAVEALRDMRFDIPDGWQPFPEWDDPYGLIAEAVSAAVERVRIKPDVLAGRHVANMVISYAVLGRGPDWRADEPAARMITKAGRPAWFVKRHAEDCFGRVFEIEADGFDRRRQRPIAGAYRKYELSASLSAAALSRLDWQLWQDALLRVSEEVSGCLQTITLLPFLPDRQPWRRTAARKIEQAIDNA